MLLDLPPGCARTAKISTLGPLTWISGPDWFYLRHAYLQIVRIDKQYEIPPAIPDLNVNYHRNLMEKGWRTGLRPLTIVQPEVSSSPP